MDPLLVFADVDWHFIIEVIGAILALAALGIAAPQAALALSQIKKKPVSQRLVYQFPDGAEAILSFPPATATQWYIKKKASTELSTLSTALRAINIIRGGPILSTGGR